MSKRRREQDETARPPKRAKPENNLPTAVEEIQFARQLQQNLIFRQDGIPQLRSGILSFKAFLESILYHRDEDIRPRQLSILREYLDGQKPADENDQERPFLGQLWQAWSFASQNNNDHLTSAVSSVLTLLLRTLSSLLDFRDYGLLLCRTVLQHQHLRLVKRSLDAQKHKDFVISPCIRLLTEVTSFDGGVLSREVYKRREHTFDAASLRRNMGLVKTEISEEDARRRPSIRTLTVRYILAHFKYQQEGAKIDILKHRPLCISLFHFLQDDPVELVNDILNATEQYVLKDDQLPRSAKGTLLTQHNLERVTEIATRSGEEHAAAQRAFDWLRAVCTKSAYGILRSSGWYPPGTTIAESVGEDGDDTIDLGLDSLQFYDRTDRPDVRNTTLLGWLQTLRPHADTGERQLLITCFESAPELVAAYFAEKTIQLEPKLSNTWIGYASFLFEVLRLPLPGYLGNVDAEDFAQLPPQTTIVLESLLPRPLTQKIITRCLNQSSELITFFALRLLVLAFKKLQNVLSMFEKAAAASSATSSLWREASERLLSRFMEKAPAMKDVLNAFRKLPDDDDHALQREATLRLLRLYYEVAPVQALEEQIDVSAALTAALLRQETNDEDKTDATNLRAMELEHLLNIAKHSPGMRWFHKHGSLAYSPFTSLLKIHVQDLHSQQLRELIVDVLVEHGIANSEAEVDALMATFLTTSRHTDHLWAFLDDCLARVSRQPVKYVDYLDGVKSKASSEDRDEDLMPGLLVAVLPEQASFVKDKENVLSWIGSFLDLLLVARSSLTVHSLRKDLSKIHGRQKMLDATEGQALLQRVHLGKPQEAQTQRADAGDVPAPSLPFEAPPQESDNHPELLRWAQKDLELALQEGDIDALMLCLCSKHPDIRKQARAQLRILRGKLQASTLNFKAQLHLLVGELLETYEQQYTPEDRALPHLAGSFACHALHVLMEPTHFLYAKMNHYLMRSPEWRVARLPSYWLANTALSVPDEDDAYWKEVQWVLGWLVEGVRTAVDVDIFRRGGVFEKVMSIYNSPAASVKLVKENVMELLFRVTCVEGFSNVLITRCGVLSWLDMVKSSDDDLAELLKRRVLETCDRERIEQWSGVGLEQL